MYRSTATSQIGVQGWVVGPNTQRRRSSKPTVHIDAAGLAVQRGPPRLSSVMLLGSNRTRVIHALADQLSGPYIVKPGDPLERKATHCTEPYVFLSRAVVIMPMWEGNRSCDVRSKRVPTVLKSSEFIIAPSSKRLNYITWGIDRDQVIFNSCR